MRVLVVRHHDEDSAGLVGEALMEREATLDSHLYPIDGPLPDPAAYDHVVVLGSKWSVYDDKAVGAWVGAELDWLRRAVDSATSVLGICFGAQLLSTALGGAVEPAPEAEIGWVTVEPLAPAQGSGSSLVGPGPWFQFHADRCVLPPSARQVARNRVCAQAFTAGSSLGVQFHPEIDARQLADWYDHGGLEEVQAAGLDPDALLAETAAAEPAARRRAQELVDAYLSQAAGQRSNGGPLAPDHPPVLTGRDAAAGR